MPASQGPRPVSLNPDSLPWGARSFCSGSLVPIDRPLRACAGVRSRSPGSQVSRSPDSRGPILPRSGWVCGACAACAGTWKSGILKTRLAASPARLHCVPGRSSRGGSRVPQSGPLRGRRGGGHGHPHRAGSAARLGGLERLSIADAGKLPSAARSGHSGYQPSAPAADMPSKC
jgi:hypothetical protein